MDKFYSTVIDEALEFACRVHKNQYRKNPEDQIPFIHHPMMVALILQRAGFNAQVIAAGMLHDVLEDTTVTYRELETRFGPYIAGLVREVSEQDKKLPWEERKRRYIEHIKTAPDEAKAISVSDKIHNIQSILKTVKQGIDIWQVFKRGKDKQLERFKTLLSSLEPVWRHPLLDELAAAIKQLEDT